MPPLAFGPFVLDREQQQLLRDGQRVALGPRPYAVLEQLIRHAGHAVGKHALLDAVWGHRHLSESVLKGCINTLRVTLGDTSKAPSWIETVPRRGYRFIGVLHEVELASPSTASASPPAQGTPGNLPAAPGRSSAASAICGNCSACWRSTACSRWWARLASARRAWRPPWRLTRAR